MHLYSWLKLTIGSEAIPPIRDAFAGTFHKSEFFHRILWYRFVGMEPCRLLLRAGAHRPKSLCGSLFLLLSCPAAAPAFTCKSSRGREGKKEGQRAPAAIKPRAGVRAGRPAGTGRDRAEPSQAKPGQRPEPPRGWGHWTPHLGGRSHLNVWAQSGL